MRSYHLCDRAVLRGGREDRARETRGDESGELHLRRLILYVRLTLDINIIRVCVIGTLGRYYKLTISPHFYTPAVNIKTVILTPYANTDCEPMK